jgi:hypothetical protein
MSTAPIRTLTVNEGRDVIGFINEFGSGKFTALLAETGSSVGTYPTAAKAALGMSRAMKVGYHPDIRNGEVCACETYTCHRAPDGEWTETFSGFCFLHYYGGDCPIVEGGFETLAEAEAAGLRHAKQSNAVFFPRTEEGEH